MYDVIIIGAGVSGLFQLHRIRGLGLSVRVFEAGADVGGTWYWNRYPGARFDSESYSYGYSFSPELLDEWEWSEHFAAQPETLRYLNHVADHFDLRRDITFGRRVTAATWHDDDHRWVIDLDDGTNVAARFVINAIGALSAPSMPSYDGMATFAGRSFHTAEWPTDVDLTGQRVGIVGTGATAVQAIQEIAKVAGHLTIFQRTPNWCAPLHNRPIGTDEQARIHASYEATFALCRSTFGGFLHDSIKDKALDATADERAAFWNRLYDEPGFGIWMANYRDVLVNAEANALLSDFIAGKIRSRVHDPVVAEKLIPTNHGFGTRRIPLESGYYEVFNEPNVRLVDLRETPIARIDAAGIATTAEHHDLDVIVYATGFDAVVGPFNRIDIRGVADVELRDVWSKGPRTYLGLMVAGFPNMFITVGPHNAAAFCNMPRCIEHNVEWFTELIRAMTSAGQTRIEATAGAQDAWMVEVEQLAERMLLSKVNSWFTGINSNIAGRSERAVLLYVGGFPAYQDRCRDVAGNDYAGFERC
jgi:cation diffusion facilitator CzcD-associated flavoprotein CzcO